MLVTLSYPCEMCSRKYHVQELREQTATQDSATENYSRKILV